MTRVQIQDAKAKFAEYIERAGKGETILITKHGKPTAVLQSIAAYQAAEQNLSAWESLYENERLENDLVDSLFVRSKGFAKARTDFEDLL
jgi:prevent-host-death family protein